MRIQRLRKSLPGFLLLVGLALVSTSCVPLAVGAVGGYMLRDDGVRFQKPITRDAPPSDTYYDPGYEY
ncbi:hypothetical protein [Roseibacillus persicicus]|uniref:hypothetical protein n=1 Tax=Roseibacillus persicicus TaxID=454148 RepID=UPI002810E3B8|nr:hypothetical protein [Roseibacillus persicicus]